MIFPLTRLVQLGFFLSLMPVAFVFGNPIPFKTGTPEEVLASIDKVVLERPKNKAGLQALNTSLAQALSNPETPVKVRERSAWALGRLLADSQMKPLTVAAKDKGLLVRMAAIDSLIYLRSASAYPTLIDVALNDSNPKVRYWATLGVGLLKTEKAIKPLVQISSDPNEEIRGAATLAMAILHSKKNNFSQIMKDMAQDNSDFVQKRAQVGQDMMSKKSSAIINYLQSTHTDIRLFSASYLKLYGQTTHVKALQAALDSDPNDQVLRELEKAISSIKGRAAEAARIAKEKADREKKRKEAEALKAKNEASTGGQKK